MKNPINRAVTEPFLPEALEFEDKIVKVIEKGGSFGDMMEGTDNVRSTNAVATEECDALRLNKKTYQVLLNAQLKTENYSRYHFLSELPIFRNAGTFALSKISLLM